MILQNNINERNTGFESQGLDYIFEENSPLGFNYKTPVLVFDISFDAVHEGICPEGRELLPTPKLNRLSAYSDFDELLEVLCFDFEPKEFSVIYDPDFYDEIIEYGVTGVYFDFFEKTVKLS